jgi:hypothetical protein
LFHLVFESHDGRALGAESEEKREPVSDIDTGVVDSLKALDPERPIREADVGEEGASPYTFNAIMAPALRRERGGWSVRAEK